MPEDASFDDAQTLAHTGSRKRRFSPAEDDRLRASVGRHGTKHWDAIAIDVGNRTSRQCWDRWHFYLDPEIKKGEWTPEEEEYLISRVDELGQKWAIIGNELKRSANNVKNHYWLHFTKTSDSIHGETQDSQVVPKIKKYKRHRPAAAPVRIAPARRPIQQTGPYQQLGSGPLLPGSYSLLPGSGSLLLGPAPLLPDSVPLSPGPAPLSPGPCSLLTDPEQQQSDILFPPNWDNPNPLPDFNAYTLSGWES
jgi:hypothetical protein